MHFSAFRNHRHLLFSIERSRSLPYRSIWRPPLAAVVMVTLLFRPHLICHDPSLLVGRNGRSVNLTVLLSVKKVLSENSALCRTETDEIIEVIIISGNLNLKLSTLINLKCDPKNSQGNWTGFTAVVVFPAPNGTQLPQTLTPFWSARSLQAGRHVSWRDSMSWIPALPS